MKVKIFLLSLFLLSLLFCSCNHKKSIEQSQNPDTPYHIYYAQGFQVNKYENYTLVSIRNPWDTTQTLQTYILVDKQKEVPTNLPKGILVRTPLEKVVAYSTIHCSTLNELDNINIIKGVCESEYVKFNYIQDGIKNGSIIDLGMASNPDVEKIIMMSPEAILASPINGQTYGNVEKTKIPIIETPDYTEPLPLGRAEWIRFYSLFVGKEQQADSLFNETVKNYNEIKDKVKSASSKPTILVDSKYQSNWNVPGGKSYLANMLADAGGDYIWSDNESNTFLPLSFEAVLDKAYDADLWLIKYYSPTDMTYTSLEKEYKLYARFNAFKNKKIWGSNTLYSNYYEDLPIHPDRILKDFGAIFHPELFSDYTPKYYKKLAD